MLAIGSPIRTRPRHWQSQTPGGVEAKPTGGSLMWFVGKVRRWAVASQSGVSGFPYLFSYRYHLVSGTEYCLFTLKP